MILPEEVLLRFWGYVAIGPGCWEWLAAKSKSGYGAFTIKQYQWQTHRLSFEIHVGPIPPGRLILHRCDNKPCVRPSHLYAGTYADNANDALERDRWAMGERAPQARLTLNDVLEIRRLYPGETQVSIARRYGVHPYTIWAVLSGASWKRALAIHEAHLLAEPDGR